MKKWRKFILRFLNNNSAEGSGTNIVKKTAFIIPSLNSGGAEKVVSIWSSELSMLSKDVCLFVLYKTENEYPTYGNIRKIYLSENYEEHCKKSFLRKKRELRRKLKEEKIRVAIPFVTYTGIITTLACLFSGIKVVETIRIVPNSSPANRKIRAIRNLSVFMAARCIVQNAAQREYFPKFMHKKFLVQPNPVHNSFFEVAPHPPEKDRLLFVTAGRIEEQKNHIMLCNAFKKACEKYGNIYLNIYGEGSRTEKISEYIKKLGLLEKIKMCGRTSNMPETLQNANAFILSSDYEGMPNALMEAMAAGLPCISTDCPTGPSDIIENNKNGILVPVNDEEAMEKAICFFVENYEEAFKMGIEAKKSMKQKFEASANAKTLFEFIESI